MDTQIHFQNSLIEFKQTLGKYITQRLKQVYGKNWIRFSQNSEDQDSLMRTKPEKWDIVILINLIYSNWDYAFKNQVSPGFPRSILSVVKGVRNLWAHQQEISTRLAYRAYDSMSWVLEAFNLDNSVLENYRIEALKEMARSDIEEEKSVLRLSESEEDNRKIEKKKRKSKRFSSEKIESGFETPSSIYPVVYEAPEVIREEELDELNSDRSLTEITENFPRFEEVLEAPEVIPESISFFKTWNEESEATRMIGDLRGKFEEKSISTEDFNRRGCIENCFMCEYYKSTAMSWIMTENFLSIHKNQCPSCRENFDQAEFDELMKTSYSNSFYR